jgi:REP element-mobilizing transposase RayT
MSRNYKFHNPNGAYFISFAIVEWLDVFTRNEYKDIFLESLTYSQENKGMEIYAWCIMTNHFPPDAARIPLSRYRTNPFVWCV